MKLRMNNKLSVLALSVAALTGGLGMSGVANADVEGSASTDFTTTINVTSDNTCTLTVTPPADTSFSASWVANSASGTATMTNTTTDTNPHYITVTAAGGTTCSLNNVRLETTTPGKTINKRPAITFGSSGGNWTYGPALAAFQFYTDDAFTTAATGAVTGHNAQGTYELSQGTTTAKEHAGDIGTASATLGPNMALTDSYSNFIANASLTDIKDGLPSGSVTFSTDKPTEIYKSAKFGIGVTVSTAPVDAVGTRDIALAANGDVVTMPFTVTVTEA